jgi:glycosyltransferase involved in cell wall biosynthesis
MPEPDDDPSFRILQCVALRGSDTRTLLSAFGLLVHDRPALALEVLGEGPIGESVHRRAVELGLEDRLSVRDLVPWTDLQRAVSRSTVTVFPTPGGVRARQAGRRTPSGEPVPPPTRTVVLLCPAPPSGVVRRDTLVVNVTAGDALDLAQALADVLDDPPRPATERLPRRTGASRRPPLFRRSPSQ